ncbi:hypothetical protein [Hyalangium sp.]|uniref:hypothetical protein n=1 Tax=Hyalangium sp. TaxID=2028555 RepID=UPI002D2FE4B8|nr:hypothetical protein [Hyalangium sp.]HYH97271.1 hypothetical protein [Hyalangium sp.]
MAAQEFLELLQALLEKTQNKEIKWLPTTEPLVFRIALGDGVVRIEHGTDNEGDRYYSATLLNRKGFVLDELTQFYKSANWTLLSELFTAARRSALSVDDVLSSMFKDLNEGKTRLPPEDEDKKDDIPF